MASPISRRAAPLTSPSLLTCRIYYEDTDASGVAYHATYLRFAERGRTEWLRAQGLEHSRLRAEQGLFFAVRHLTISYESPARLDDRVEVETTLAALSAATLDMHQILRHEGRLLGELTVRMAVLSESGKPRRIPEELRTRLAAGGMTALPRKKSPQHL